MRKRNSRVGKVVAVRLLLPRSITGVIETQIRSTSIVGLSHTLSEFTGTPVRVSDLVHHLAQIRRSEMIRLIANMTVTIAQERCMTVAYQLAMAENLLPPDVWAKVSAKIPRSENHAGRLFHRRQLWFLLQMAVIACSEDSPVLEPIDMRRRAGLAALMASDVLAQVERAHTPRARDGHDPDQWGATTLPPLIDQRPGDEIICRSICMWLDMQNDAVVQSKMARIGLKKSLDQSFSDAHGLSLRDFMCILMTAYSACKMGASLDPPEIALLEPAVISGMPYSLEKVGTAIALAGIAPDALAPALMASRESWATDFTVLRGKPLLEIFPDKYACADEGIFTLFFMDGIYDLLENILSKGTFRELFGTMFEQYINHLFESFLYSGTSLVRQFATSPKYAGENTQAADGIALLGRTIVLMEYKGGMLTKRQKYGTNVEETIKGLNGLLARFGDGKKGVGQLVDNLERLLRGDKIHTDGNRIDIPADTVIIPTLVVYDDCLGIHAIRNHLDGILQSAVEERGLIKNRIGPLVVLTTRDVEGLQEFSTRRDVSAIISDYCEHLAKFPGDMAGSFHGFLLQGYRSVNPRESFVQTRVREYREELILMMEAARELRNGLEMT